MKLLTTIRQRLGWKLCLSYLLVVLAVVLVLDTTAEFRVPTVLWRDVARFPVPWRHDPALMAALHASFQAAVNELLVIGSAVALLVAVALSLFTARRIVRPIQAMMQASQRPLELRPVNLAALLQTAADRLQPQFEDKDIRLHVDVAHGLPHVHADAGRLLQVLLNLLGNALRYTPSGGQVSVRACRAGPQMVIEVHDTGIGIAAEH